MRKKSKAIKFTIGDLYGNAMKLIFMLVKHGIATNVSKKDYQKLVEIYKTPADKLKKEHLEKFSNIVANIKFCTELCLRFLGDELADRGSNDYFTLKVLERLEEANVSFEIILSNHGVEFIEAYEKQDKFSPQMLGHFTRSMQNLQKLVDKGHVSREEILAMVNKAYKPALRVISYSLSKDKKEMTIYSHAGIGLNTIKRLSVKLNVAYKDTTAIELAQTI